MTRVKIREKGTLRRITFSATWQPLVESSVEIVGIYLEWESMLSKSFRKYFKTFSFLSLSFFIAVQVQLFPFSPHHAPPTPAIPTSHPRSYPPLAFSMCSLYMFLNNPSTFSHLLPTPLGLLSVFFLISMSLIIFCLLVCFVDYVPLIGEIMWYLSFTSWLISLSIMLSRSIHAVAKGRSSFFLSPA